VYHRKLLLLAFHKKRQVDMVYASGDNQDVTIAGRPLDVVTGHGCRHSLRLGLDKGHPGQHKRRLVQRLGMKLKLLRGHPVCQQYPGTGESSLSKDGAG